MKRLFYKRVLYSLLFAALLSQYSCKNEQQDVLLESFTLNVSDILIGIDEIQSIIVSPAPDNITENIRWESNDPEIAQVQANEQGLVSGIMGLKVGSTTIVASTKDGEIKQSIPVRVIIKVTGIALSPEIALSPSKVQYNVIFTPANTTIQDITWTSSDPEVASVDNGILTALAKGTSILTATTVEGGKSASIEVFVSGNPPVFGKEYCTVAGNGDYCPDEVRTEGAIQNITHVNTAIPTGNYKYFPEDKLIVKRGSDFTMKLIQSNNWSWSCVWIDWNFDQIFTNATEQVAIFGDFEVLNNGPFSKPIHAPADAVLNTVRMRVFTTDSWGIDLRNFEPCGNARFGTFKDFDIETTD